MNKLEARYAALLEGRKLADEIADWKFESIKLILADRVTYLPDFAVLHVGGRVEFVETKGFLRDDARIKVAVAAKQFPWFSFTMAFWDRKQKDWRYKKYGF
jgi:hypothetical protein